MTNRSILHVHPAKREDMDDLVTARPALPLDRMDPFLLINHHGPQIYPPGNRGLPFGPHPHRGFETLTFILDGELAHKDSTGHESVIGAGGVQWMTAGAGIVHSETSPDAFLRAGGPLEILQLWINLPSRLKMSKPGYTGLQQGAIPALAAGGGVTVHLISGAFAEQEGPIHSLTGIMMAMVDLRAGSRVVLPAPPGRSVFFYVVRGRVSVGGVAVTGPALAELDRKGEDVIVEAGSDAFLLYGHGDVIGEPVAGYGPFVMNTRAELEQAIRDFQAGKFTAA